MKRIVGIIEARMGSTRLPGKVLLPIGEWPSLELLIRRVSRSKYLDEIVVATTTNRSDDAVVAVCDRLNIRSFRGSEHDVLDRVLKAARFAEADIICELMGDSPFLDPILIDQTIIAHLAGDYDYTSNFIPENTFPLGFAAQVYSVSVLERVSLLTGDPIDRVHVSCFIYHNPKLFRLQGVSAPLPIHAPDIRLCLDTRQDYELICKVYEALFRGDECFSAREIVKYLRAHPEQLLVNKDVKAKAIEEG